VLEHFRLVLLRIDEKDVMPFLVPAMIEAEDCFFQLEQWKDMYILLRPVYIATASGPAYRFVGVCLACTQFDDAWVLSPETVSSVTRLELNDTPCGLKLV